MDPRAGAEDHRDDLRQTPEAKRQRRAGAFVDLPTQRHGEHLRTDDRDESSGELQSQIGVTRHGIH